VGQGTNRAVQNNATMVENFLKFGDGFTPFMGG
jgi:hypothetical protein